MNSEILAPLLAVVIPFGLTILALALRIQSELTLNPRFAHRMRIASTCVFAIVILGCLAIGHVIALVLGMFIVGRWIHFQLAQAWASRQAAELELIWLLALSAKSTRSLLDEVEAYAGAANGYRQRRLLAFSDDLRSGLPLQKCLPFDLFSRSTALQLQAAMNGEGAAESLKNLALSQARTLGERQQELEYSVLAYPLGLLMVLFGCSGFLMYYIIPKFKKIFEDFGTELPEMTMMTIGVSDAVVNYWYLVAAPAVVLAALAWRYLVNGKHVSESAAAVDLLGRLFVRMHAPEILRSLATAIAAGQPITSAVKVFIQHPGPPIVQNTIEMFCRRVQLGEPAWDELRGLGIIRNSEQKVIESATRAGNLPWALTTLAENLERRWQFRFNVVGSILRPVLILAVSVPIGFFVISMFMPLIKLLHDLS